MERWTDRAASWLTRHPFLLFAFLYTAIAAVAALADRALPDVLRRAVVQLTGGAGLGVLDPSVLGRQAVAPTPSGVPMWAIAAVAMACAGMFALPLAWLYTITRQKRGYRQSVVHSLILLPVVVAGVVVLVKFSLALAFSLAGIVAAVRFRTTLEDSKDAVYIFVATGIGLASGVELSVAATLSVLFNLTTLLLFRSDFGRTPARLEGDRAEERMRRALAMANRTSQFVARLDREVLEQMAPEQLTALADRAWQRRQEATPGVATPTGETATAGTARLDGVLRVRFDGAQRAREAVELVLLRMAKRWQFQRVEEASPDGQVLVYTLRLRRSVTPTALIDAVRQGGAPHVRDVDLT